MSPDTTISPDTFKLFPEIKLFMLYNNDIKNLNFNKICLVII